MQFHSCTEIPMPCEEIPMQSRQQIQSLFKFMLSKEDLSKHTTRTVWYQKKTQVHHKNIHRNPKAQLHAGPMYVHDSSSHSCSEDSSSNESFCLQLQIQSNHAEGKQIPNPVHLIMNLAYQLKPHHTRNMYL